MRPKSGNSDPTDTPSDGSAWVQQTFGFGPPVDSTDSGGERRRGGDDPLLLDLGPVPPAAGPVVSLDADAVVPEPGAAALPVQEVGVTIPEAVPEPEDLLAIPEPKSREFVPEPAAAALSVREVGATIPEAVPEPEDLLAIPEPKSPEAESIRTILRRPSRGGGEAVPMQGRGEADTRHDDGAQDPVADAPPRTAPVREVWRGPEPAEATPGEAAVTGRISSAAGPAMGRPGQPPWQNRQSIGKIRGRRRRKSRGLLSRLRWLALLPAVAAVGWLAWKVIGGTLWKSSVRGRDAVAAAVLEEARGATAAAASMMDKAVRESVDDPEALRLAADYYLQRRDEKAAGVVGLLMKDGRATELDLVRAAEFSVGSDYPELMPSAVQDWLSKPVESSLPRRLIAEARWLERCGQHGASERRLRDGLLHRPTELSIDMALCALLVRPAGEGELATERILDGLARLEKLQNRPDLPVREQMEAAGLRVEAMTKNHGMLRAGDEVVDGLRHSVRAMFSRLDEGQKLGLDLQLRSMDLAIRPEQREQIVKEAVATWSRMEAPEQLRVARWLGATGNHEDVLRFSDRTARAATDPDWARLRLESLLAQERYASARTAAAAEPHVLPVMVRALYTYRAESGEAVLAGGGEAVNRVAVAVSGVQAAVRTEAVPEQLLEAGRWMAKRGDWIPADMFLRAAENDAAAGMLARLERIRLLRRKPEQEAEYRKALEAALAVWPQADGIRMELLHLKLLAGEAEAADYELAERAGTWVAPDASWKVTAALAELRRGRQPAALQMLEGVIPAEGDGPVGWLVVQAAVLAAGNHQAQAEAVRGRIGKQALRPGERALLEQYLPSGS